MKTKLRYSSDENESLITRIYKGRGFNNASEWLHYLSTTKEDLVDPLLLDNMKEGAKILIQHISDGDKMMIQIDSDCDGFTSAAVLMNYLNCVFPSYTQNNIFYRPHIQKHHGILLDTIPDDVRLVVIPDASSNEYNLHKELSEKGIDVLILDHHEAPQVSKYACVINNQLCDYPTKSLSGVGVVYKFCSYLDSLLGQNYADNFLDLVALGIIADVMNLRDYETRYLVDQGLKNINNPFFKGMCLKDTFHFKPGELVTPEGVAWYIAPAVNAVARMGDYNEQHLLFESMLDYKAYNLIPSTKRGCKGQEETIVEQACRNCTNIKNRQNNARDTSLEIIEQKIKEEGLLDNKILIVKLDKKQSTNSGLNGLIANQLKSRYGKPVLILNQLDGDLWAGSARNVDNTELNDFKQFIKESGYADYADGHANAFGVQFTEENLNKFIEYSEEKLKTFDFSPIYLVDLETDYRILDSYIPDFYEIGNLNHIWGRGVEQPVICIKNIKISNNISLFSSTLKIALPFNEGISLVKFKSSEEEYKSLYSDLGCVTINVVGIIQLNTGWDGKPQIIINDYQVVDKQNYYF